MFAREAVAGLLKAAVADGVFPGMAYGVLQRGQMVALDAVGSFTFDRGSRPVEIGTTFDLASLTKVMATTAMAMLLWQRGVLDLDTPVGELAPAFLSTQDAPLWRWKVTLRLLLAHAGGLPGYAPLFETYRDAAALREALLRLPMEAAPGAISAYSDPGFILLGQALEVVAGEPLDRFCAREIFEPLEMSGTRFCPETGDWAAIPPTEKDDAFRRRVVQGEVQDENCFVLGGVAGHAGLFAPAGDVLRFAEAMLGPLHRSSPDDLFEARTVELFTRRAGLPPGSLRALGWDTPSGSPSSAGSCFSAGSFGHLGYSGTSLWIDADADIAIVLLTNRTFPTRENRKIQTFRPEFHDAVRKQLAG